MQTIVKKWFRDKGFGFLGNGTGPDIMVRKADLISCQYLKVGSMVEFDCHFDGRGLIAKKVTRSRQQNQKQNGKRGTKAFPFGVMT